MTEYREVIGELTEPTRELRRAIADKMLPPRKHGVPIPRTQSQAMKLAFEKYFLRKDRHSHVDLP